MLETTWLFVLALAHVATVGATWLGLRSDEAAVVLVAALLGAVLFGMAAMGAPSVEVVTQDGSTVRQAHPGMGWYALGLALVSGAVAIVAALAWFGSAGDDTYGNPY